MENIDLRYLCTTIGNLAGIPVRIFEDSAQTFFYSMVRLPKDPMALCRDEIFAVTEHVGYCVTPEFHYYGIVNAGSTRIVVGPTRQIAETAQELRTLAFRLDLSGDAARTFAEGMRSIVRMPIESVLQMLCTVNYVLHHEKLELRDIRIHEQEQAELTAGRSGSMRRSGFPPQLRRKRRRRSTTPMIWSSFCCGWCARGIRTRCARGFPPPPPSAAASSRESRCVSGKISLSSR